MAGKDDTLTALEKQVEELTKKLEAAQKDGGAEKIKTLGAELETAKAAATKAAEEIAALKAENAELVAKGKMTPDELAALDGCKDEEDKKKFIAMTPEERAKRVDEIKKGDEVITVAGVQISKKAVGEAQFAVIKSQQAEIAKNAEALKAAEDKAQTVELTKRAESELANLPGEVTKKVEVLKALAGMPKEARETLDTMLKAGDAAVKLGLSKMGHGGDKKTDAGEFMQKVAEIKKRDNCGDQDAFTKARTEHPDAFKQYQASAN